MHNMAWPWAYRAAGISRAKCSGFEALGVSELTASEASVLRTKVWGWQASVILVWGSESRVQAEACGGLQFKAHRMGSEWHECRGVGFQKKHTQTKAQLIFFRPGLSCTVLHQARARKYMYSFNCICLTTLALLMDTLDYSAVPGCAPLRGVLFEREQKSCCW